MARGELATIEPTELPAGWVMTTSGRISGVTEPGEFRSIIRSRSTTSSPSTTR